MGWSLLVPQDFSSSRETGGARKQMDHLQSPEHHLEVIEEAVEEAEARLGPYRLRECLANNPERKLQMQEQAVPMC